MKIKVDKSFLKDFDKIKDKEIRSKIKQLLLDLEKIEKFNEIQNVKKLKGFDNYYRVSL